MKASFTEQRAPSCGEGREKGKRVLGGGDSAEGQGITDEAKLILETIKSLKRERVFGRTVNHCDLQKQAQSN